MAGAKKEPGQAQYEKYAAAANTINPQEYMPSWDELGGNRQAIWAAFAKPAKKGA